MGIIQVNLRQGDVAFHHLHRRMPQDRLKGEDVSAVSQIIDRKGVSEPVGMTLCDPSPLADLVQHVRQTGAGELEYLV